MSHMSSDSFGARSTLEVSGRDYEVFRLDALQERFDVARLPYSIKVLLENVLRLEDGVSVSAADVEAIASWDAGRRAQRRDPLPAGAGADAGLHRRPRRRRPGGDARRDGGDRRRPGGDQPAGRRRPGDRPLGPGRRLRQRRAPSRSTPSATSSATSSATRSSSGARSPSTTSASCRRRPGSATRSTSSTSPRSSTAARTTASCSAYPDTLVGTDSHTTMVNGLGVLGWGVGGIEAEAAMLGQPISMLLPQVVGFKLAGELPEGATATDLVLTVTEMLRERGVVSKFVEFFGAGPLDPGPRRPGDARQHVAGVRLDLRDLPGRRRDPALPRPDRPPDRDDRAGRRLRPRAGDVPRRVHPGPGLLRPAGARPRRRSCPASPARNGRRTGCRWPQAKESFLEAMGEFDPEAAEQMGNGRDEAIEESFPASDPPAEDHDDARGKPRPAVTGAATATARRTAPATRSRSPSRTAPSFELDHGRVVIAAITSCTNTSNPSVMVGAGLLARNARQARPHAQAVGEDLAGAGLDRGHRLPASRPA